MRLFTRFALSTGMALGISVITPSPAVADVMDCTTGVCDKHPGSGNLLGGARWVWANQQSTGTGVIDPFVRLVDNNDVVFGHNTSGRSLEYHENTSPNYTKDLRLGTVPLVSIGGVNYYEFLLDINQEGLGPLLNLDFVRICTSSSASLIADNGGNKDTIGQICPTGTTQRYQFGTAPTAGGKPANNYNNYSAGDSVLMDYNLNHGSGSGDLFMYVPASNFAGVALTDYLYFFSMFGVPNNDNDGFEEWATRKCGTAYGGVVLQCVQQQLPPVPEPGTMILLGAGLVGLGVVVRRRHQGAAA